MKKFARFLTMALALAMMISCFCGMFVSAAESEEEYTLFIAYGGDKAAENDWGYEYYGADSDKSAGITATNATAKVGDTVTISLAFDAPNINSWFFAPCLVPGADGAEITNIDFDVSLKIDGNDVAIDMAADADGKTWWVEGTGDFSNSIRLAGGYNEWATKYIAEPAGFSTIEYTITLNSIEVGAAASGGQTESTEEYDLFIAYGGDKAAENDWGYEYYGADTDKSAGITAVNAKVKSGDTVTVSLSFAEANFNSWFFAPCLIPAADGQEVSGIDFDIVCKIDGVEVPIDMAADADGKTWWVEGTGDYSNSIRLAGGYNEWGAHFIAEPAGFSTIEYTITFNSILVGTPEAGGAVESTEEYDLFIAYGGDKAAENDWGYEYYGAETDKSAGITAVNAKVKSGDTATISLSFAEANVNSWFFAPTLAPAADGKEISNIDFTVTCKIDGVEVPIDMAADADGKTWWVEGTGSYTNSIRLAGGYNEWATKYIAEPAGFTTIEYTITFNSIQLAVVEEAPAEIPIDLDGTYNAYLMLQTPNWTFRDAYDSTNGIGSAVWGQHITNNDSGNTYGVVTDSVVAGNGTYTVSITDFGTVFADDFAAAGQEYFNIIGISTDIPKSDKISITNVQLIVDGKVRHEYETAVLNPDTKETCQILVQNIWNSDVAELSYYPAPTESLEIKFTVSGFNYDNASQGSEAEPTEPQATEPQATEPQATEPTSGEEEEPKSPVVGIVIGVVAVAAVAVGAVVVLKKKKN